MAFVKVGSLAALPPGSVMEAEVGEGTYAICNVGGELSALDGICPHAGGPLGQGNIDGDKLVCPWHEWAYYCQSGVNDYDENVKLAKFPVGIYSGEAFDAANAIIAELQILSKTKGGTGAITRINVVNGLHKIVYHGLTKVVSFQSNGDIAGADIYVNQVVNGNLVQLGLA